MFCIKNKINKCRERWIVYPEREGTEERGERRKRRKKKRERSVNVTHRDFVLQWHTRDFGEQARLVSRFNLLYNCDVNSSLTPQIFSKVGYD